jgi:hypothetical protein
MFSLLCVVLCTVCVQMCTGLLPPAGYPIAVNKYIISYINLRKAYHTKLHVQMVFLVMNTGCSKHVEDAKNWITALILQVSICWFTLHNLLSSLPSYRIESYVLPWVQQSLYRPGQIFRAPAVDTPRISTQPAREGVKVVTITHRPLLTLPSLGDISGIHFC